MWDAWNGFADLLKSQNEQSLGRGWRRKTSTNRQKRRGYNQITRLLGRYKRMRGEIAQAIRRGRHASKLPDTFIGWGSVRALILMEWGEMDTTPMRKKRNPPNGKWQRKEAMGEKGLTSRGNGSSDRTSFKKEYIKQQNVSSTRKPERSSRRYISEPRIAICRTAITNGRDSTQ